MSTQQGIVSPPPGVEPNFINPPNHLQVCTPFQAVYLTLNSMALVMRLYTRRFIIRDSLRIDDCYNLGLGRSVWDIPRSEATAITKSTFHGFLALVLCLAFSKLAILSFYYRLFCSQSTLKALIIIGVVFEASASLALVVVTHYTFTPFEVFGDPAIKPKIPRALPVCFSSLLGMTTDIYTLVLPIPSVLRLKVPLRQKFKALAIIILGASACAASIMRVYHVSQMKDLNVLWNIMFVGSVGFWAALECDHALLCSCLLILPVFIQHHWPKLRSLFGKVRTKQRVSRVEARPLQRTRSWPVQDQWNVNKRVDIYIFEEVRHFENRPNAHLAIHPNRPLSSADIERGEGSNRR
ncbi:hypothetical protein BDV37DRAFT_280938 [Aspergillus pseudonomiae]|uniref:Rhodopsin domain-containing protein n=1 Tax=Aspergillus pseudonomiae TaxID=1506151 RepID=A0A5N7DIS2_9EURO|nr:uncharacterized protein BDV37DRAFT_280938 [Aspergillus pseudonomiae]KAE8406341.1 hypothetical protein BDV37DRAFT_280938 [Aspergillus pseudonomiae]